MSACLYHSSAVHSRFQHLNEKNSSSKPLWIFHPSLNICSVIMYVSVKCKGFSLCMTRNKVPHNFYCSIEIKLRLCNLPIVKCCMLGYMVNLHCTLFSKITSFQTCNQITHIAPTVKWITLLCICINTSLSRLMKASFTYADLITSTSCTAICCVPWTGTARPFL